MKTVIASTVVRLNLTTGAEGKNNIEITNFHERLYAASFRTANAVNNAVTTQRAVMTAMLRAQYGNVAPTYAQFRADRNALAAIALRNGLVDDQWVRKPYNSAVIGLYGALPVSDSPAALAKRAQRPVAVKGASGKSGAKKGDTAARAPAEPATIEQFIAKHGAGKVLAELARILATKKETELDARTLVALSAHYK